MNEEKVRNAVKVANELIDIKQYARDGRTDGLDMRLQLWRDVFNAMLYDPSLKTNADNLTTKEEVK